MTRQKAKDMRSFRIWKTGTPAEARLDDVPGLEPGPGEVVVDVQAAAVGFVDTLVATGRYQTIPATPFTPGMEFSGRIRAIGSGVYGCAPGDEVAAYTLNGGFAEQAIAGPGEFFPVPKGVALEQAALMSGAYLTAHMALTERAGLVPDDIVLVGGAGGAVGLAAVRLAKALGAGPVLGAVLSSADAQAILDAGADAVVDLSGPDLREGLRAQVRAATGGRDVDIVIDPLGADFLPAALRVLAFGGRLIVVGFAAGDIPVIRSNHLLLKNISASGLNITEYRKHRPDLLQAAQAQIFELAMKGQLKPRIAREFRLDQVAEALDFVAKGHTGGRALVRIGKG